MKQIENKTVKPIALTMKDFEKLIDERDKFEKEHGTIKVEIIDYWKRME